MIEIVVATLSLKSGTELAPAETMEMPCASCKPLSGPTCPQMFESRSDVATALGWSFFSICLSRRWQLWNSVLRKTILVVMNGMFFHIIFFQAHMYLSKQFIDAIKRHCSLLEICSCNLLQDTTFHYFTIKYSQHKEYQW